MDEDEMQQFSLRWHNHQSSVIGALGRMLSTGALTDVTLNASGTSLRAHRLVLASCSQYFAQLFKEVEAENTLVVVLSCEATELRLLLTFMYTGEVTASKEVLPSLLRLAQTLKVSGLTDADTEVETENTLVVVLSCEATELRLLLTFMYTGEVTASKEVMPSLLRLAQTLKVSGLTDADTEVEAENTLVVVLSCEATELRLLLTFMYTGEVTASKDVLPSLLRLAQTLKVSGLTDADTEMEAENTLVVVLSCEATELRLLLAFMYTGEVTASKEVLPSLLRLAQTLKVFGLTDADTNPAPQPADPEPQETRQSPTFEPKPDFSEPKFEEPMEKEYTGMNDVIRNEKDRLSKLDQIVQNLYSTHKIGSPGVGNVTPPIMPNLTEPPEPFDRKWRLNSSVCTICHKRLSNQYNLRVHMETHAGRRHACRACSHVSRSRDALRKHVAYRHATNRDKAN